MVKKIGIVLILLVIILSFCNVKVLGKTNHFKAFITQELYNEESSLPRQTVERMVDFMEALEWVNYSGTGTYSVATQEADVRSYINMSSNNYGFVLAAHTDENYILCINDDENLYPSEISGNWHLVLLNSCSAMANDSYARAFKTVGYTHRAAIGFTTPIGFFSGYHFWRYANQVVCSTSLGNVVDYANNIVGCDGIIYGDSSWNGYAWH